MSKYAVLSLSEALEHELEDECRRDRAVPWSIATNIALGARNRPDHLGGPSSVRTAARRSWRSAWRGPGSTEAVGERVVDAIRNKTFYAFVSAVPADVIRRGTAASRRHSRHAGRRRTRRHLVDWTHGAQTDGQRRNRRR